MAIAGYTKVKADEKQKIIGYLKCGMPQKQIVQLTGRTAPTIRRIRDEWRDTQEEEEARKVLTEEKPAVVNSASIVNSDYAKAKRAGDAKWQNNTLTVEKSLNISSAKTGFTYRMRRSDETVDICIDADTVIKIPQNKIESFADELIDVVIEIDNFRKN